MRFEKYTFSKKGLTISVIKTQKTIKLVNIVIPTTQLQYVLQALNEFVALNLPKYMWGIETTTNTELFFDIELGQVKELQKAIQDKLNTAN